MEKFLQQLVSSPELLQNGYQMLMSRLQQPEHRHEAIRIIHAGSSEYAICLLQNVYQQVWESLSEQQKCATRLLLTEAVYNNCRDYKYLESLAIFISKLHSIEGYQHWLLMYTVLVNKLEYLHFLQFFLVLYRESDNRIHILTNITLQKVMTMKQEKLKSLMLLYLIVKSLSNLEDYDPVKISEYLQPNINSILMTIHSLLTENRYQKYCLKILTCLAAEAPNIMAPFLSQLLPSIWSNFNSNIRRYVNENVMNQSNQQQSLSLEDKYMKEIRFEENTESEGIVYQEVELMRCLLTPKNMNKFTLCVLVVNLVNLLLITVEDEKIWLTDQNRLFADIDDEHLFSLRNQITQYLYDLVSEQPECIGIIKITVECLLLKNQEQLKHELMTMLASDNSFLKNSSMTQEQMKAIFDGCFILENFGWKLRQVATYLLYISCQELFQETPREQILQLMGKIAMDPQQHELLKIQALRTLAKCSQGLDGVKYMSLLAYCLELIHSSYLGMRIMSMKCIGVFSRLVRNNKMGEKISLSDDQVKTIVELCFRMNGQTIHLLFETCIELVRLNQETAKKVTTAIGPLSVKLVQAYHRQGLLFSIMLQLFGEMAFPSLQQHAAKFLAMPKHNNEHSELRQFYIKLMKKYVENKAWTGAFSQDDLLHVIKALVRDEDSSSLVREYVRYGKIDNQLNCILMNCRSEWVIPLMKRGIQVDARHFLMEEIKILLQVTSQYEFEKALVLLLYFLNKSTQETKQLLRKEGVYDMIVEKWLKYQRLFQGDMLKRVTVVTLTKLKDSRADAFVKEFVKNDLRKMELGDLNWQDQDNGQINIDSEQWLGKMCNEEVENQLKEDFPDLVMLDLESYLQGYAS